MDINNLIADTLEDIAKGVSFYRDHLASKRIHVKENEFHQNVKFEVNISGGGRVAFEVPFTLPGYDNFPVLSKLKVEEELSRQLTGKP